MSPEVGRPMMRRILFSAFTIAILVFIVARGVSGQQAQRPLTDPIGSFVDYVRPPSTLLGLIADVAVVVRGRVLSSSPDRWDVNDGAIPLTAHDFQIDEVFKRDPVAVPKSASTIRVIQIAGTMVNQDGKVITGALKDVYKPGQELIVFLNVSPRAGGLTVAYGPAGAFFVMNEEVLIPEVLSAYPEFEGRRSIPTAAFVQLLRQLAIAK